MVGGRIPFRSPTLRFFCGSLTLAVCQLLLINLAMLNKSPTFDEPAHLSAGYNFWLNSDYRQGTDSSVFSQKWAALPLLGMKDLQFPSQSWQGKVNFNRSGFNSPKLASYLQRSGNSNASGLAPRIFTLVMGSGSHSSMNWAIPRKRSYFAPEQ